MTITYRSDKTPESRLMKDLSSGGFTIIETLIAILLFAISLSGGIAVYFNANQIKTMAVHKEIATEVMSSTMEELRRQGYVAFGTDHGSSAPTSTPETFTDDDPPSIGNILTALVYTYEDPPTGAPSDFRRVTANLAWTESFQGSPREISATTYVAP